MNTANKGRLARNVSLVCMASLIAAACTLSSRTSRSDPPPPHPEGYVLIYTDNTPGALLWAYGYLWAVNANNHEVQVVTSVSSFENTLPQRNWSLVVVAEKHTEGVVAYSTELASYVDGGGWAHIFRWKEPSGDPPLQHQILLAPTALHVWRHGHTAWAYFRTTLDADHDSGSSAGYITKSFNGVQVEAAVTLGANGMEPLAAGVIAAGTQEQPPQSCKEKFKKATEDAWKNYNESIADCDTVYGPSPPGTVPFDPGNPEKLVDCYNIFADFLDHDLKRAAERYRLCRAMEDPEPPQ